MKKALIQLQATIDSCSTKFNKTSLHRINSFGVLKTMLDRWIDSIKHRQHYCEAFHLILSEIDLIHYMVQPGKLDKINDFEGLA